MLSGGGGVCDVLALHLVVDIFAMLVTNLTKYKFEIINNITSILILYYNLTSKDVNDHFETKTILLILLYVMFDQLSTEKMSRRHNCKQ